MRTVTFTEEENGKEVPTGRGWEVGWGRGAVFNGPGVAVWEKKVPEVAGGDGCMTA